MTDTNTTETANLGKVQEMVLRTAVRNGVKIKKTGAPGDLGKSLEKSETFWDRRWIARAELKRQVYNRRKSDVTKASNRVSVSRAVHALVERELLDAKFVATGAVVDGSVQLHSYGEPGIGDPDIGDEDKTPTYSLVRVSNEGKKLARSLRSVERNNGWAEEIRADRL